MNSINYRIDNLQYCNWSEEIFKINRQAGLDAIHVTIAYHEDFNEVLKNIQTWNKYFNEFDPPARIVPQYYIHLLVEGQNK